MNNDTLGLACEHGMLARACEVCEMQSEITALRAEVERLTEKLRRSRVVNVALGHHEMDAVNLRSQLSARDDEVRALRGFAQDMYKAIRTRSPIWHDIADAMVEHSLLYKPGPFVGIGKPTPLLDPQGSPGEPGPGGDQ